MRLYLIELLIGLKISRDKSYSLMILGMDNGGLVVPEPELFDSQQLRRNLSAS
jgi:hypothetical protein